MATNGYEHTCWDCGEDYKDCCCGVMSGYVHEGMDRLSVAMNHISDYVLEHPGMKQSGADKHIDKALGNLMEAYQVLGEYWDKVED